MLGKITKWLTYRRISIVLYLIALFLSILTFYESKTVIHHQFSRYSRGYEALLAGWIEKDTRLPWISNILYFIILITSLRKNYDGIFISLVSIVLALQILSLDVYISHFWTKRIHEEVSIGMGFYFWIGSYIVLLIGTIKENFSFKK